MIDFQFIKTKPIPVKNYTGWIKKVVHSEKKIVGDIIFIFCNDDYLLEKNIQFLNHHTLTDVITFDYCEDKKISGDILISIDRVIENAKLFNVTFLKELDRVMVHGLLHLLGYNDKTKKDSKLMRIKEDFYINNK